MTRAVEAAEQAKPTPTQEDIGELLVSFSEPKAVQRSAAELERMRMATVIHQRVASLAELIVTFSDQTTDVESLAGALKSLQTVKYRAKRAIGGVPDEVLDPPAREETHDEAQQRIDSKVANNFQIGA